MELKTYFAQDAAGNIISSAIVNVFLQGTNTPATGLTRADGTPLENPFAADGAGRIQFRAPDGYYDVKVSAGSGIIQTLTIQCVDYSGAKADADRAEAAADRADSSAESAEQQTAIFKGPDNHGLDNFYGGGGWDGPDEAGVNIYNNTGITYTNALRQRYSIPETTTPNPTIWIEKKSSATRSDGVSRWEQGAFYGYLEKTGGSAYGAAGTFSTRHNAGTGQLIALHARGEARHVDAEVWGGWSYAAVSGPAGSGGANTGAKSAIIHEFNMNNGCSVDAGWMVGSENPGNTRGLVCVTQDGSNRITHMINIGRGSAAPNGFIWTGLLFRGDSIVPPAEDLTLVGNGEYMRLEGSISANAANGIRFRNANFRAGISFTEASFSNNCAILLGDNQRITVGSGPVNTTYLAFNRTSSWANFNNLALRMNGVQVLTTRRTGWGNPTGTLSRASFDSSSVSTAVVAQTLAALITDLSAHGIIGPT